MAVSRLRILAAALALLLAPLSPVLAQSDHLDGLDDRALLDLAQRGDVEAAARVGADIVLQQQGARYSEARLLLEKASDAGHAEAANTLATMHYYGLGGAVDKARSKALWDQAAEAGSIGAKLTLIGLYFDGDEGYAQDQGRAFRYAREVAELPVTDLNRDVVGLAQWRLAMMYLRGAGVGKDLKEAYRWTSRSADNGFVDGMISKAVMLATGEGVEEDDESARATYQRAADQKVRESAHALRGLGGMLITGEGGPADLPRGFGYLMLAHATGDGMAKGLLERFATLLTSEVEREAKAFAEAELKKWPTSD